MKGKLYKPSHSSPDYLSIGVMGECSTFKYPIKSKTIKKFKVNTREFSPVRYMWKSSIPVKWFTLASPSRFLDIRMERLKTRNTLQFLEETQKYIYHIRKPLAPPKILKIRETGRSQLNGTQSAVLHSRNSSQKKIESEFYLTAYKPETTRVFTLSEVKSPSYLSQSGRISQFREADF
jgi:hypothetical protein